MANIVITLQKSFWQSIESGNKTVELRKSFPLRFQHNEDKCFVVLKGTNIVVGYFIITSYTSLPKERHNVEMVARLACVPVEWVEKYYSNSEHINCWNIGKVVKFNQVRALDDFLIVAKNPQSYVYIHN